MDGCWSRTTSPSSLRSTKPASRPSIGFGSTTATSRCRRAAATVEVELQRLGGEHERFTFRPEGEYLRGSGVVAEPHSFDVTVRVAAGRQDPSNGSSIPMRDARRLPPRPRERWASPRGGGAGKPQRATDAVGSRPGGSRASFQGARPLCRNRPRSGCAAVDECCARCVACQRTEPMRACRTIRSRRRSPDVIVEHRAQVGEATGEEPLFTIVDTVARVGRAGRVPERSGPSRRRTGGRALRPGRSQARGRARCRGSRRSRFTAVKACARVSSSTTRPACCVPGSSCHGRVTVGESKVALAVEKRGLQTLSRLHCRLRAGRRHLRGPHAGARHEPMRAASKCSKASKAGARYVTRNSYLIKADIEKAGASHDH